MPFPPILFEDDSLLVFDKPAGLLVAPDRADRMRENLMREVHAEIGRHVTNVHRLDAETSGVLLCAKTKPALDFLSGQFQAKTAQTSYHALVVVLAPPEAMKMVSPIRDDDGALPDAFDLDLVLGPEEGQPGRMRVFKRRGGKPSSTSFRTLERFGRFAWIECRPYTSRMHQLRIHLAAAGAPILGDRLYGAPEVRLLLSDFKRGYKGRERERPLLDRLALHASALTVVHPETRQPLAIQSPLPPPFEVALKQLRRHVKG